MARTNYSYEKRQRELAKTKKKLHEASTSIDNAEVRTRAIERKLRKVQEIPVSGEKVDLPEKTPN